MNTPVSEDKQRVSFLLQYKGRLLNEAFCDQYFGKLKIDKMEGSVNTLTGITTAYVHHAKKLLSDQWFNAVKKHNKRFPEEQIEWVGVTAPDDLRHSEAYKSIKAQKDFEWKKNSCKERPLGKRATKQQRLFKAFQELAKRQKLARSFIEASVSYLMQQRKEAQKRKAAEEAEAKAKEREARKKEEWELLRKQQAQREKEEQEELKALEPVLQDLSYFADIFTHSMFVKHLYLMHPPTGAAPQFVPYADRKNLLNAIRAYHTDKQSCSACGLRTYILRIEITKILNGLLEAHR